MPAAIAQDKSALFAQYQILEELGDFPNYSLYKVKAPNGSIKLWKKVDMQFNAAGIETRLLPVIERVHHPYLNAVSNSFHFPDKGLLFVESDFPAKTLRHRLAECRTGGSSTGIPVQELMAYMQQAAEAVDYLTTPQHNYNGRRIAIYHRALSPDSLQLFEEKGKVVCKVGDFGLAKPILDSTDSARHSLGMTNFDYSPPEYDEGIIANTSDQFALATTYCELKTGKLPFTGSLLQKLQAQLSGTPDLSLLEANERPVLARALAREPQARFVTCKEFVQQLQAALGGVSTFAMPSSRVLGTKSANGADTGASSTGWGAIKPVGKSGGALFEIGTTKGTAAASAGGVKTPAKPEGHSLLGSVSVGGSTRGIETKLSTLEKQERKEKPREMVKAKEAAPVVPQVPISRQPERVTPPPTPAPVNPAPIPDANWMPGQVTAQVRPGATKPKSSELTVDPPTAMKLPTRQEISDKAKGTLEALKKRHHQAAPPGAPHAPAGTERRSVDQGGSHGSAPSASYYDSPVLPARRASTDHIGDRLPFRPPPVPVPRRSSSPGAAAAANVTPFQALRTNVPPPPPTEATSPLTLFLIAFSAFCIGMLAIAYFNTR